MFAEYWSMRSEYDRKWGVQRHRRRNGRHEPASRTRTRTQNPNPNPELQTQTRTPNPNPEPEPEPQTRTRAPNPKPKPNPNPKQAERPPHAAQGDLVPAEAHLGSAHPSSPSCPLLPAADAGGCRVPNPHPNLAPNPNPPNPNPDPDQAAAEYTDLEGGSLRSKARAVQSAGSRRPPPSNSSQLSSSTEQQLRMAAR